MATSNDRSPLGIHPKGKGGAGYMIRMTLETCLTDLSPGQIDRHLADDIFRFIFMNETYCILIQISLKFVPRDLSDNKSALV